ncbi:MAG: hypothetical protein Q7T82_10080 [Armatimonadota bacterium]|nr:hypothetical protein [Armatimonadota bacterium]
MGFDKEPQTPFEQRIANGLTPYLDRWVCTTGRRLRLHFYTKAPTEVVFVCADDPTLHVECVLHGPEEGDPWYEREVGLSPNHVLIGFDLHYAGLKTPYSGRVRELRPRLLEEIRDSGRLQALMPATPEDHCHHGYHVAMEVVAYREGCRECEEHIVSRMVAFVEAFYWLGADRMGMP